ncbi:hypothetical protein BJV77DRAFT_575808 [Russula vinacea]|nr:hypothetical protein BJV77DRAFT_575808 [Russula vinacea]
MNRLMWVTRSSCNAIHGHWRAYHLTHALTLTYPVMARSPCSNFFAPHVTMPGTCSRTSDWLIPRTSQLASQDDPTFFVPGGDFNLFSSGLIWWCSAKSRSLEAWKKEGTTQNCSLKYTMLW